MADGGENPFGMSREELEAQIAAMKQFTGKSKGAAGGEKAAAAAAPAPLFSRLLAEALKGPAAKAAAASVGNASIDAIIAKGGGSRMNEESDGHCFYRAIARQHLGNHERYPEMRLMTAKMFAAIAGKAVRTAVDEAGIETPILSPAGSLQFEDLVIEGVEPDVILASCLQEQQTFDDRGSREECVSAILEYRALRGASVDPAKLKYTKEQTAEKKRLSNAIKKIKGKAEVSEKNQLNRNILSSQLIDLESQVTAGALHLELGFDPSNVQEVLLNYANYVATTNLWAGQLEAYHLAAVLDTNIIWFDLTVGSIPKLRYFKVPNDEASSDVTSQPIVVAWSGRNHYESILPPAGGWKPAQLTLLYRSEGGHGGGRRRTRRRPRRLRS